MRAAAPLLVAGFCGAALAGEPQSAPEAQARQALETCIAAAQSPLDCLDIGAGVCPASTPSGCLDAERAAWAALARAAEARIAAANPASPDHAEFVAQAEAELRARVDARCAKIASSAGDAAGSRCLRDAEAQRAAVLLLIAPPAL